MSDYLTRMTRCDTCGHGRGVHEQVRQPLRIWEGKVEFYQSLDEAPDQCTGYPDMMAKDGKRCLCRRYIKPVITEDTHAD